MSFEEARNSLVISFAEGSISEEEVLNLYHEYESVNPLYPYWEFEPFCLDSLDSSECKSAKGNWFINKNAATIISFTFLFCLPPVSWWIMDNATLRTSKFWFEPRCGRVMSLNELRIFARFFHFSDG